MKPIRLEICGWGPYKDVECVEFSKLGGQGLFLITGATGAGKTTLFDAVTYALYGALSGEVRDKERGGVRSDFARPDTPTYVELEMEHRGREYRIRRNPEYMRPRKKGGGAALAREKENAVLWLPGGQILEGVKEVNTRLQEILALDYSQFKQISMIAQGEFARLLTAPPRDKTRIFRQIFDTGIYERFTAELGARARAYYEQVKRRKQALEEQLRGLVPLLLKIEAEQEPFPETTPEREYGSARETAPIRETPAELRRKLYGERVEDARRMRELLSPEYLQYDAIEEGLGRLLGDGDRYLEFLHGVFQKQDEELARLQGLLQSREEENRQIRAFRQACEEGELLAAQRERQEEKKRRLDAALAAMDVDAAAGALELALERCRKLAEEKVRLDREVQEGEVRRQTLLPLWELREEAAVLVAAMGQYNQTVLQMEQQRKSLRELETQLEQGRETYLAMETAARQAQGTYERALQAQRHAAIGLAAKELRPGSPCPVCGSLEHPAPARVEGDILSEEALEALERDWKSRQQETEQCHGRVVALGTRAEDAGQQLRELELRGQALRRQIQEQQREPLRALASLPLEQAERQLRGCTEQMAALTAQLEEKRLRQRAAEQERLQAAEQETSARQFFEKQLEQSGLLSRQTYEASRMQKTEREALQKEIQNDRERMAANASLREHLRQEISRETPWDNRQLCGQLEEQKRDRAEMLNALGCWEGYHTELKRLYGLLLEKRKLIEAESRAYGSVKELDDIASGNNGRKLVFEQYVLAGYFEEILRAANVRFGRMTGGRYEMRRVEEVGDGRVKDNLEIEVLDFHTGKYRSVRTLSGGETFKASLALALGLSDVIQAASGGVRVDALFIDEGFGALDSESLDQACETLLSLAESDRLIGVISHVPELKERIRRQVVVDKSGSGSRVRLEI